LRLKFYKAIKHKGYCRESSNNEIIQWNGRENLEIDSYLSGHLISVKKGREGQQGRKVFEQMEPEYSSRTST
jgi:hypothetical protein